MTDQNDLFEHQTPPSAGSVVSALPMLMGRIFNTPLLIAPDKLQAILFGLKNKLNFDVEAPADAAVMSPGAAVGRWEKRERASGMIVDGGVGIIPITGTLVNRGAWLGTSSGLQSYEGIAQQLRMAADDERVLEVLLDINCFGGEAAGVSDLAAEIRELSQFKRVTALVSDNAHSAAYWIAAAAAEIVVTETGYVGSIGVVLTHQDLTGMAEKEGVRITQIHAGADKLLGSPWKPLTDSDKKKLQADVDQLYDLFVSNVAAYRGLDAELIRKTEARSYRGQGALDARLANRMMSGRALLAEMQSRTSLRGASRTPQRSNTMSNANSSGGAVTQPAVTQEQVDAARADGLKAGKAEGVTAERARIKSILTHAEASGREQLAQHLAFSTDQSVDAATALLAVSPKAAAAQAKSALDAHMAATGTPGVSGEDPAGQPGAQQQPTINSAEIFANRSKSSAGK